MRLFTIAVLSALAFVYALARIGEAIQSGANASAWWRKLE